MGAENILLAAGGAGLAYFFYKSGSTTSETTLLKQSFNAEDYVADASEALDALENNSNDQNALALLQLSIDSLQDEMDKLVRQPLPCNKCALELHLETMNRVYASLVALGADIRPCITSSYYYYKNLMETILVKQTISFNLNDLLKKTMPYMLDAFAEQFLDVTAARASNTGVEMTFGAIEFVSSVAQTMQDLEFPATKNASEFKKISGVVGADMLFIAEARAGLYSAAVKLMENLEVIKRDPNMTATNKRIARSLAKKVASLRAKTAIIRAQYKNYGSFDETQINTMICELETVLEQAEQYLSASQAEKITECITELAAIIEEAYQAKLIAEARALSLLQSLASKTKNFLGTIQRKATNFVGGVYDTASNAVNSAASTVYNAGKTSVNAVSSAASGVVSAGKTVGNAVKSLKFW